MTDETLEALPVGENTAETMRNVMEELGKSEALVTPEADDPCFQTPHIAAVPKGRQLNDLTQQTREAAQFLKPARRMGTARLSDLDSLILWANRFKGETSALFAKPDQTSPTLTCVADYHAQGAPDPTNLVGEPTARHCHHRAVYTFPVSDEWRAWMKVSGTALDKDEMGEFIEANAKDIMDPTPPVLDLKESDKNEGWENRLIQTAKQIEGRYGQLTQLLIMSRQFQVFETSNLTVTSNRDTGEQSIQFLDEHKDKDGAPIKIPNLIIIAIPVFEGGALYRLPVRFRYRKSGASIKFIMSIYNPQRAFGAAFDEALQTATAATELPLFKGSPEAG